MAAVNVNPGNPGSGIWFASGERLLIPDKSIVPAAAWPQLARVVGTLELLEKWIDRHEVDVSFREWVFLSSLTRVARGCPRLYAYRQGDLHRSPFVDLGPNPPWSTIHRVKLGLKICDAGYRLDSFVPTELQPPKRAADRKAWIKFFKTHAYILHREPIEEGKGVTEESPKDFR